MLVVMPTEETRRRALAQHRAALLKAHVLRLLHYSRSTLINLLAVNVLKKPGNTLTRLTVKE